VVKADGENEMYAKEGKAEGALWTERCRVLEAMPTRIRVI